MNMTIVKSGINRPLFIDFDQYTDGDVEFKKELIYLMIENLTELKDSLSEAIKRNKLELFDKTCHKIKPTLGMLGDNDLMESIQSIRNLFHNRKDHDVLLNTFTTACTEIAKSLEKEGR